ncbi:MAG TPA: beta-propeller domain-containing protein [Asanoa sp.]
MTSVRRWSVALGAAALLLLSGCTGDAAPARPAPKQDPGVPSGRFALVAFDSCADALSALKKAAADAVGPYGFGGGAIPLSAREAGPQAGGAVADRAAAVPNASTPEYSGTNTHEAGVDEPDIVKTDGRRIVTVGAGVLRVVDAATRRETGSLRLSADDSARWKWAQWNLLLSGDRALVFSPILDVALRGGVVDKPAGPSMPDVQTRLLLIDLAPAIPKLVDTYTVDGSLVDARQISGTARVVIRSVPRLEFPMPAGDDRRTDAQRVADNRRVIEKSTMEQWLPRWSTDRATGQVGCERVSRPAVYSGTSLLTVLSFDLDAAAFSDGDPTTLAADGEIVYSNGTSLYVTNDQRWRMDVWTGRGIALRPQDSDTEIFRFDISRPGTPRFAASGKVPGWIINQYARSEWDGYLRVATTSGEPWGGEDRTPTTSAVYVVRTSDLTGTGKLGGLGKGERIYAVRFVGTTGYVVTFRQTDPLYTVDLSDPAHPRAAGELKITGYSAYLHPADGGRLIGIGQEASAQGRVQGTQVSLFDVHDLANPKRLAQRQVSDSQSAAEYDPHAFLYWPATQLVVVPVMSYKGGYPDTKALVLRLGADRITDVGTVSHPGASRTDGMPYGQIQRSMMIGDTLWTLSTEGLQANDPASLAKLAWVPL